MRNIPVLMIAVLLALTADPSVTGQGIELRQSNPQGIYKKRQKISITARKDGITADSIEVRIVKNDFTDLVNKKVEMTGDSLVVFEGSFDEPCSVMAEVRAGDSSTALGLMVAPWKLKPGGKCPDDFTCFWKNEKEKLEALPMKVRTATVPDSLIETGFSCVDIELDCTGPRPARGYFAKPVISSPRSLPAVILVHAAGVKGSWCRSEPGNALKYAREGALCFDLNAHGMLNGQPEEYYAALDSGELKNYYYKGITSRDEFYFRGMYLRLMRTIDFLANQPEWDRKRILVIGESQGGGQALVAAGLDKRVSAVVALVPAMCDWLAPLVQREAGWPQPLKSGAPGEVVIKTVPYFDAANILRKSKAKLFVEIGLIDITCPPASVYAAINQARGKKIIYPVPYREHHQPKNNMTGTWEETVFRPREAFIMKYLK